MSSVFACSRRFLLRSSSDRGLSPFGSLRLPGNPLPTTERLFLSVNADADAEGHPECMCNLDAFAWAELRYSDELGGVSRAACSGDSSCGFCFSSGAPPVSSLSQRAR